MPMSLVNRVDHDKEIPGNRILLNIGGTSFVTSLHLLRSQPDTMLGSMFAEGNQPLIKPNEKGEYFIDFTSLWFDHVLQFYSTGKPVRRPTSVNPSVLASFDEVIDFWAVPSESIVDIIHTNATEAINEFLAAVTEEVKSAARIFVSSIFITLGRERCYLKYSDHGSCEIPCSSNMKNGFRILSSPLASKIIVFLRKALDAEVTISRHFSLDIVMSIRINLDFERITKMSLLSEVQP
ncbi:hypothetical protein K493DRAFT_305372 [Basidiobolus meristosporus CBS 931.73]|uniref:Potassium channel tetramerisation-type BTB domain-containing protein n=1 Tax=Basidiobolus meristosporus CBS 931.73 TaxID=1314790 RepID=A0A1Y1XVW3_9FUNG|nr:hypothetical protein K493DRAFT_305372 [Basidiobolus meristosporus CBS 931.73]|eukprot:ORX89912.1 hypothetical protein K493DRAFT_305372 [Basidiobolus meristosporus CBS 931.73]